MRKIITCKKGSNEFEKMRKKSIWEDLKLKKGNGEMYLYCNLRKAKTFYFNLNIFLLFCLQFLYYTNLPYLY